jgi:hypothetical protein
MVSFVSAATNTYHPIEYKNDFIKETGFPEPATKVHYFGIITNVEQTQTRMYFDTICVFAFIWTKNPDGSAYGPIPWLYLPYFGRIGCGISEFSGYLAPHFINGFITDSYWENY